MGRSGKGCGGRKRGGGGTKQSCARDRGERVLPRPASRRAADRRGRRPRPTRTRGGGAARDLGRSAQPRGCRLASGSTSVATVRRGRVDPERQGRRGDAG